MAVNSMAIKKSEISATFGAEVKRLREACGWSQTELASMLGVGQGFVSHIEKGRNEGKIEMLFALSKAFDVPCDHFRQFFEVEKKK